MMTTTDDKPASIADQIRALHKKARREDGYGYAMAFRDAADIAAEAEAALRAEIEALRADRDRLAADLAVAREALVFYADQTLDGYDVMVTNYGLSTEEGVIIRDNGDMARAALAHIAKEADNG